MQRFAIYENPERGEWRGLTERNIPQDSEIAERVESIIARIAEGGDSALREVVALIEGSVPESFELSKEAIAEASERVSEELKEALKRAKSNIEAFHSAQLPRRVSVEVMEGVKCEQRSVAIRKVGLYVPGGTAPLVSTVLMLAIPATIAGCREIVLCTPPSKSGAIAPEIIYAASLCGVHRIFTLGGAQAVAAMAYGTESIPRVDKIFGPGNRYVTKAKQIVSTNRVAIDMPAGPSEVLVLADESANAEFVASDLLSQAEHGADSQAILVCSSVAIAEAVAAAISHQTKELSRGEAISKSLEQSRAVVFDSTDEMVEFAEEYAAEHLIISMRDPWEVAERITSAGSIFIGNYSPESAGDYASGTNHTLPTGGWARSYSGVSLESFMRKQTYQQLTAQGIRSLAPTVLAMAEAEGLDAHANAVRVRVAQTEGKI
ncbi:MAG: histidinol dehydrogenase [Rikenellaceae bacterium]